MTRVFLRARLSEARRILADPGARESLRWIAAHVIKRFG